MAFVLWKALHWKISDLVGFGCLYSMVQLIVLMDFAADWILKWSRKDLIENHQFRPTDTFVNKHSLNFYYVICSWAPRRLKNKQTNKQNPKLKNKQTKQKNRKTNSASKFINMGSSTCSFFCHSLTRAVRIKHRAWNIFGRYMIEVLCRQTIETYLVYTQ